MFKDLFLKESGKSVQIKTKKSPLKAVDIVKYTDGTYGILSFVMDPKKREFLKDNGFTLMDNKYYSKEYETLKDLNSDLKSIFGVTYMNEGTVSADIAQSTGTGKKECPCKKNPTSEECKKKKLAEGAENYCDQMREAGEALLKFASTPKRLKDAINKVLDLLDTDC